MEGAPSVERPHNLAGFRLNFYTTLIACSQITCLVVVEERLAMSKSSSTTSKPTVTSLMNMTSLAVSDMSVLSSKARLKAENHFNLFFKGSLISSKDHLFYMRQKRPFVLHETEKTICST